MKFLTSLMMVVLLGLNLYAVDYEKAVTSIQEQAVVIGKGKTRIYAFIDPLCSKSRNFLELITENRKLQEMNTYYLFLYRMPKYKSDRLIAYIYDGPNVLERMERVMIKGDDPVLNDFIPSDLAIARKRAISEVADQFEAKARPYILLFKEGSHYCKVSEGTAPCMEKSR